MTPCPKGRAVVGCAFGAVGDPKQTLYFCGTQNGLSALSWLVGATSFPVA